TRPRSRPRPSAVWPEPMAPRPMRSSRAANWAAFLAPIWANAKWRSWSRKSGRDRPSIFSGGAPSWGCAFPRPRSGRWRTIWTLNSREHEMADFVLAVDQGTTSSRAMIFDGAYGVKGAAQQEFPQIFPRSGWVEHDPEAIWQSVIATMRGALAQAKLPASEIAAIGITNQRETALIWDKKTGRAIHSAIVWQDRRTAD